MKVMEIEIYRNERGMFLRLQSDFDWSFLHQPFGSFAEVGGVPIRKLVNISLPAGTCAKSDKIQWASGHRSCKLFEDDLETINVSFLGAKSLSNTTFFIGQPVMSAELMKEFAKNFSKVCEHLYKTFVKPA